MRFGSVESKEGSPWKDPCRQGLCEEVFIEELFTKVWAEWELVKDDATLGPATMGSYYYLKGLERVRDSHVTEMRLHLDDQSVGQFAYPLASQGGYYSSPHLDLSYFRDVSGPSSWPG